MDDVLLLAVCEVVPDRPRGRFLGVSGADERTEGVDGIVFFQDDRDAGPRAHELEEVFIEGLASVDAIEFTCALERQVHHFHRYDSEARFLYCAENLSHDSFSNAIRFENR